MWKIVYEMTNWKSTNVTRTNNCDLNFQEKLILDNITGYLELYYQKMVNWSKRDQILANKLFVYLILTGFNNDIDMIWKLSRNTVKPKRIIESFKNSNNNAGYLVSPVKNIIVHNNASLWIFVEETPARSNIVFLYYNSLWPTLWFQRFWNTFTKYLKHGKIYPISLKEKSSHY